MKKLLLLLAITFVCNVSAQNKKTKKLLEEIKNEWKLDDNSNLSYVRVIDIPNVKTKEEIYNRALNYFVYNYGSGKSVIQTKDKELGTIVAKGLYKDVFVSSSLVTTYVDCWHILRVDVKEGKARIILTLTEYEKKIVGGNTPDAYVTNKINESFPVNPKGRQKTFMGKTFYYTHEKAQETLNNIEKSLKEGNTYKSTENNDW